MDKLESNKKAPLYQQLYDAILNKVRSGEYQVGEKIPSEEQLMTIYGVSRVTVRNAIKQLVDENILFVLSGVLSVLFIVDTIVSTHVALDIEKKLELVKQVLEESENRLIASIEEKQNEAYCHVNLFECKCRMYGCFLP